MMTDPRFKCVSLSEVIPYMNECFPDEGSVSVKPGKGELKAYILANVCFSIVWEGKEGVYIAHIGTLPGFRRQGYARKMLDCLATLFDGRPMYAECAPKSHMYVHLQNLCWEDYHTTSVCPTSPDTSRHLMGNGSLSQCLQFVPELYESGYGVDGPYMLNLCAWAQRTIPLPAERTDEMLELFRKTFPGDFEAVRESLGSADCYVTLDEKGEHVVAFCIHNWYDEPNAVVVEYIGVAEEYRRHHIATMLCRVLESQYLGSSFFGVCHHEAPIFAMLRQEGWVRAPINWDSPDRNLLCKNANPRGIVKFAESLYSFGSGVPSSELVRKYRDELGVSPYAFA